jgi:hydroxyacylglutathione hydrolase
MDIHAIPAFEDNIIWALESAGELVVVDPGDAGPVIQFLTTRNLRLSGILITHHHGDHTGGIAQLRDYCQVRQPDSVRVFGPERCRDYGVTETVEEGATVPLLRNTLCLSVLVCPGHTTDHIAYFGAPAGKAPILFCGDTLFAGGCGRLLGGTAEQLYGSLQRLAALPPETEVYCAHEYTLSNLLFAAATLPANPHIRQRLADVKNLRANDICTLPSSIAIEKTTNPFLLAGSLEEFAARRRAKDSFRPT